MEVDLNEASSLDKADRLAQFLRLDPSDTVKVNDFRSQYPQFAPKLWWAHNESKARSALFDLWRNGFPADKCIENIVLAAALDHWTISISKISKEVGLKEVESQPQEVWMPKPGTFDLQDALMFLYVQPWRAAYCLKCGNPFVKVEKGQKYCTPICFNDARKAGSLTYYHREGAVKRRKRSGARKRKFKRA